MTIPLPGQRTPGWFAKFLSYLSPEDEHLNRFAAIPLPQRLEAHPEYTGKGVTIAFLDSDYQPHPDLKGRIKAFHDVTGQRESIVSPVDAIQWHGTQTSVVCAGDGALSNGAYKGLASGAHVVLVKISDQGTITGENILKGLRWVLDNQEHLEIRLVNISLGADRDDEEFVREMDGLLGELEKKGVLTLVAAGNSGFGPDPNVYPPADSPLVLTVGGYSDENVLASLEEGAVERYASNYGVARDETVVKPEVLAPAAWVAAPLLPGSEQFYRAAVLSKLDRVPDYRLRKLVIRLFTDLKRQDELPELLSQDLRSVIHQELVGDKIVAEAYQHVDGTSFATPIVTSVAAQMLEANPLLTPTEIRAILTITAVQLRGMDLLWQGYGVVHPRRAVERALTRTPEMLQHSKRPRLRRGKLIFDLVRLGVETAHLVGDFNDWDATSHPMENVAEASFRIEIPCHHEDKFRYKFVLNGEEWVEDAYNPLREVDEFGNFNSILFLGDHDRH